MQAAHVLPMFLQKRHQEVDGQMHILGELIRVHLDVSNGDRQAQHFLHLELDGGLDLINFSSHGLGVSQQTGEFTSLVQTGSQQSWNLLDQRLGGQKGVVFLGKLLHKFLVLVQFLEGLGVHVWDFVGSGLIAMLLISEDANLHLWAGDELQP